MTTNFDVIVIGAGPAGSVAASKLIQDGFKVKILEKMEFPRFVIGESLLPHSMDFLDELGLLPAVVAKQFQVKTGACFYLKDKRCDFLFEDQYTQGWNYTYQVKRADFDQALALEVQRQGADLEFNAEVKNVQTSDTIQTVNYVDAKGVEHELTSRFIVDASGYGRVLPRMFNLEVPVKTPPRGAIFSHVQDNNRTDDAGRNIFVHAFNNNTAWIWSIPFSDGTASVGIVSDAAFIEECALDGGKQFKSLVSEFSVLNNRYSGVAFMFEPRVILNYAVSVDKLHGQGFALCGNSTEFLDPIFSSGVTLAITSGFRAAENVTRHLKGETVNWEVDYDQRIKSGINVFRSYVNAWYDGSLQTIFFSEKNNDEIKQQICSVLAGYVWDETNPFVKKHATLLKTLSKVIELQAEDN